MHERLPFNPLETNFLLKCSLKKKFFFKIKCSLRVLEMIANIVYWNKCPVKVKMYLRILNAPPSPNFWSNKLNRNYSLANTNNLIMKITRYEHHSFVHILASALRARLQFSHYTWVRASVYVLIFYLTNFPRGK